ncbi:MAG TPA: hypothetical protein VJ672_14010 [Gemmatimonadaceae bacterium]|nr:hypothetical protein [Gemmatimonadaceae bacterium]
MTNAPAAAYLDAVMPHVPRLVSTLDREASSASAGSFDRVHWGWKMRDMPITMLQGGIYPLALLWRNSYGGTVYHRNSRLLSWLELAIDQIIARQHRDGAFDSVGPNTRDHGVTLAVARMLARTLATVGDAVSSGRRESALSAIRRATRFAARSREDYAFINNHQALFALAYLDAHELLGDDDLRRAGQRAVDGILANQTDDGWYPEYGGPDPGYETLGIMYLAEWWKRTGDERVLESLRRSVRCFWHFVHPDGSVGGCYGSRHTSLYFPSGFERLAPEIPEAAAVASFMRERLPRGNVVTPASSDPENFYVLAASYLDAAAETTVDRNVPHQPVMPCLTLQGQHHFPSASIVVAGTQHYYAVTNLSKGGVIRVFDRGSGRIAYEDSGYVLSTPGGQWVSQTLGRGRKTPSTGHEVACHTTLTEARQLLPTAWRYLLLRLANLTLFRVGWLGTLLRRNVVERLITGSRAAPCRLSRVIRFESDAVAISDRLELTTRTRIARVDLPRAYSAIHMGSAKYFHQSELDDIRLSETSGLADELTRTGKAEITHRVGFASARVADGVTAEHSGATPLSRSEREDVLRR